MLSIRSGVDRQTIRMLANKGTPCTLRVLAALAEACGMRVNITLALPVIEDLA